MHDARPVARRDSDSIERMKRSRLATCALSCFLLACKSGPSAQETLPKLRAAMGATVESPEQNDENSALTQEVSEQRHLHGLTRLELEQRLGPGDECSRHPICAERGFDPNDVYYEVGKASEAYVVRYRPALIVGFNRFGKVERTFVLRTQP